MMELSIERPQSRSTDIRPQRSGTAATASAAAGWPLLAAELDAWAASGRTATLWWRDDDAIDATPPLERLLALSVRHGVGLGLAVIPAKATPALFDRLRGQANVAALQHGFAHRNHAPRGAKKAELGADRPAAMVLAELAQGRELLAQASAGRALPVLVPPWNRIDPALVPGLPGIGLSGLSTAKPRRARLALPGLVQANTHLDPIDWPRLRAGEGGFLGVDVGLAAAIDHLRARRQGIVDAEEPTGLLTHHLVMDDATWNFVDRFLAATAQHPGACWLDPARVFALERGAA